MPDVLIRASPEHPPDGRSAFVPVVGTMRSAAPSVKDRKMHDRKMKRWAEFLTPHSQSVESPHPGPLACSRRRHRHERAGEGVGGRRTRTAGRCGEAGAQPCSRSTFNPIYFRGTSLPASSVIKGRWTRTALPSFLAQSPFFSTYPTPSHASSRNASKAELNVRSNTSEASVNCRRRRSGASTVAQRLNPINKAHGKYA